MAKNEMTNGEGYWLWMIDGFKNGDVDAIVEEFVKGKFEYVIIKVADYIYPYNVREDGGVKLNSLVKKLKEKGIQVWGYHYTYAVNPALEAEKAAKIANDLGLYGFMIDAEKEYNSQSKDEAARVYARSLREHLDPNMLIGLSSYRFPYKYQRYFPYKEFLRICDFYAPQVYWLQSRHDAHIQLARSIENCKEMFVGEGLSKDFPIRPTGAAFQQDGWEPLVSEVEAFMDQAKLMNIPSIDWWEIGSAYRNVKPVYEYILERDYGGEVPTPPTPTPPSNNKWVEITAHALHVRNAPYRSEATEFGFTTHGKRVKVLEEIDDHYKIEAYIHKGWTKEV